MPCGFEAAGEAAGASTAASFEAGRGEALRFGLLAEAGRGGLPADAGREGRRAGAGESLFTAGDPLTSALRFGVMVRAETGVLVRAASGVLPLGGFGRTGVPILRFGVSGTRFFGAGAGEPGGWKTPIAGRGMRAAETELRAVTRLDLKQLNSTRFR